MAKKKAEFDIPNDGDINDLESENWRLAQDILDKHNANLKRKKDEALAKAKAIREAKQFEKDAEW